jgi:hypothetical protein
MIAVLPGHGIAHIAAFTDAIEAIFFFPEVPAPVQLADVATDGAYFPDVGRRGFACCL